MTDDRQAGLREAIERDARFGDALDALRAAVLSEHGHLQLGESWHRKARSGIVGLESALAAQLPAEGDYPEEGPVPSAVQGAWNEAATERPVAVRIPPQRALDLANAARVYANVVEERYAGRTGWASVAEARSLLVTAIDAVETYEVPSQ